MPPSNLSRTQDHGSVVQKLAPSCARVFSRLVLSSSYLTNIAIALIDKWSKRVMAFLRQSAAGFLTVPFCRANALVKMGFEFYREH
jgi:hypothetical protein